MQPLNIRLKAGRGKIGENIALAKPPSIQCKRCAFLSVSEASKGVTRQAQFNSNANRLPSNPSSPGFISRPGQRCSPMTVLGQPVDFRVPTRRGRTHAGGGAARGAQTAVRNAPAQK